MKRWLGITFGAALAAVFLPPLLSGSNHTCPVLREADLQRGPNAQAVPAFARKYNVDCTYCHTAWPQLNRTGYIFRRLGYRMPWEVPTHSAQEPPPTGSSGTPTTTAPVSPTVSSGLKNAVTQTANQAPSAETVAAGQKVFNQMQCFTCHVNGENVINPSKPIKGAFFRSKYPNDAQIAAIIRNGVPGTAMPAYATDRLSDEQLKPLIAYIRSLTP
jgi:mono/diheme cytochrome c family protein